MSKQSEPTTIQTVICAKERFQTQAEATQWVVRNDFKAEKVDETGSSYRFRQRDPGDFQGGSLRTIRLDDGVTAVIGRLKAVGSMIEYFGEPSSMTAKDMRKYLDSFRTKVVLPSGDEVEEKLAPFSVTGGLEVEGKQREAEQSLSDLVDDQGRLPIRSLVSTPDIDLHGDVVEPEAFHDSVTSGHFAANPVMLAFHNLEKPSGLWPVHNISPEGLVLGGFISRGAEIREGIQSLVLDGTLSRSSIGFLPRRVVMDEELGVMRILELELFEVSLVPLPANVATFVEVVRSWSKWSYRKFVDSSEVIPAVFSKEKLLRNESHEVSEEGDDSLKERQALVREASALSGLAQVAKELAASTRAIAKLSP